MPNIYCPSCGQGIKYMYSKPDKCNSCNHSFAIQKLNLTIDDEDEETTTVVVSKRSRKISAPKQISVEVDSPIFEKLGQVMGSNPGETRQKRRPISKEDFKNQIFKTTPTTIDNA